MGSLRFSLALVLALTPAMAQSLNGLWDAAVTVEGVEIPFRMEFSGDGANVQGSFFHGDDQLTSSSGRLEKGALELTFDYYAGKLTATWKDGALEGTYRRPTSEYPFHARRF